MEKKFTIEELYTLRDALEYGRQHAATEDYRAKYVALDKKILEMLRQRMLKERR